MCVPRRVFYFMETYAHVTVCALEATGSLLFNIAITDMFSTNFSFSPFPT